MPTPPRPVIPPPGVPVPSFNAPPHIEAVHVELVDSSSTGYVDLARGTLYSTVTGADQRVVDQFPNIYLLRTIKSPANYPMVTRVWGLGETFTTRSIGQDNLTPAKYRRLITRVETYKPIDINDVFPAGLSGNQVLIEKIQETIYEARLHIVEEVIAIGADPLLGGRTGEWGSLSVYETVVNEGTPIDTGYLVMTSSVEPFGNGKAVKITVKYPSDLATRTRVGQRWDNRLLAYTPFQQRVVLRGAEIGLPNREIEPYNDYDHQLVTEVNPSALPQPIVSYGFRREDLPIQLIGITIIGTETQEAVPTFLYPPDIFLARYTRSYSYIEPSQPSPPTQFWAQPFHGRIEYLETTNSTSTGNGTNTSSNTRSGTHTGTSSNTNVGTSTGTHSGTDTSTHSGTQNNSQTTTSSGSETTTHSGTQGGTHTRSDTSTGTHNSSETGTSATTHSTTGAPLVGDPQDNKVWASSQTVNTSGSSTNSSSTISSTTGSGTNTNTGSSSNTSTGETSGTTSNTHSGTFSNTSNETSSGTTRGTSSGTESATGSGTHSAASTISRLSLIHLDLQPCLREAFSTFQIPATVPTSLPWGTWLTRGRQSEYGQFGVWITDTVEIYLPTLPGPIFNALFYLWLQITDLTGGDPVTDLDGQSMSAYAVNAVFEVDIDGRGTSQWRKELWEGVGTPSTNAAYGIIVPPDYNASTMNYVLIRIEGW